MSNHRLSELLSPYRGFDAAGPDELRAIIRSQATRSLIGRRVDQLLAARRASGFTAPPGPTPAD